MPAQTQSLLEQYASGIHRLYGNDLNSVILYGSYARGDFHEDSDIDVMILLNLSNEGVVETRSRVWDYTYDFNMDNDTEIMPVIVGLEHFNYWREAYPFYKSIAQEGRKVYEA